MRFFSFSLLIGGGALVAHLVLYWRLVRKLTDDLRWRRGLGGLLVAMTLLLVFRSAIRDIGPRVAKVYELVAYSWMALGLCLLIAVIIGDLFRLGISIWSWVRRRLATASPPTESAEAIDPTRRKLVQAIPWGVLSGGGITAAYGSYHAFTTPEVTEVVMPLAKLPRSLEGVSIVQLTDIHVGSFIGRRYIDMLVDAVNAERPDIVAITGDLVDGSVENLGSTVGVLAKLRARFGVYFVTGNHEYYSGELAWVQYLDRLGMTVLRNTRVEIGDAGGRFDLIGVDDWSGGRRRGRQGYDLERAIEGRDADRAAVLLAHQPENFEVAAARGIDLQVSGHTHGGQVFPMTALVRMRYPYHRGMYRSGNSRLYVSRGCGFWGPPSRLGSPPEMVKYILTSA